MQIDDADNIIWYDNTDAAPPSRIQSNPIIII